MVIKEIKIEIEIEIKNEIKSQTCLRQAGPKYKPNHGRRVSNNKLAL